VNLREYLQILDAFLQLASPSFLLILLADLFNFGSVHVVALGRTMDFEYMGNVEDGFQVLEEGIVDDLESDAEVVAKGVQDATALDVGRIRSDLIVIVSIDLRVDARLVKVFPLLGFDKQKIKEVHEAFLELLQQLPLHQLLLD
jgi:hypothetical protein